MSTELLYEHGTYGQLPQVKEEKKNKGKKQIRSIKLYPETSD